MAQLVTHGKQMNDHFLAKGIVKLFGQIDEELEYRFIKQTQYLAGEGFKTLYCYINSEGGFMPSCYGILDQLDLLNGMGVTVNLIAHGMAISAAADILIMGKTGCRFISPRTTIMMHPISYAIPSDYDQFQDKSTAFLKKQIADHNKVIADRLGMTVNKLNNKISNSLWLTADEAIKFGVADEIWTAEKEAGVLNLKIN